MNVILSMIFPKTNKLSGIFTLVFDMQTIESENSTPCPIFRLILIQIISHRSQPEGGGGAGVGGGTRGGEKPQILMSFIDFLGDALLIGSYFSRIEESSFHAGIICVLESFQ